MDDINPGSNVIMVMISIQEFVNDSIQTILVSSGCQSMELDKAFSIAKMETLKRAYNYLIVVHVFKGDSGHTDNEEKTNEYIDFENYMDSHVYIKLQDEIQPIEEQNAVDNENTDVQSNTRYEAFWEKLNKALQSSTLNPSRDNLIIKNGPVIKFNVGNCR
ncbi:unnamed protein product [Mytilus coruscus]|uniref:Uncharacterized protein n=1 Tax=Mytilus coruscus TaxID=42192 RepID=A0A6J8DHU0_MYTCO|nr:unnamed protein product [Mytilus coruscus]